MAEKTETAAKNGKAGAKPTPENLPVGTPGSVTVGGREVPAVITSCPCKRNVKYLEGKHARPAVQWDTCHEALLFLEGGNRRTYVVLGAEIELDAPLSGTVPAFTPLG